MAEPIIYSKNYIFRDCTFTLSHGDAVGGYLYDRDPNSVWISDGADDDATQISIQVDFYEGGVAQDRTIDRFFLINHNLKTWTLEYWNGSTWVTLTSESADAAANTFKTFAATTTTKIRLTATATQIVDAEKYIGEMIACSLALTIGEEMAQYDTQFREKTKELVMGDGSIHYQITRHSPYRTQKYGARVRFNYLSASTLADLQEIKEAGQSFLWQPESSNRPQDIYYVHWTGPFDAQFSSLYKGSGYNLSLTLKEV
jgi:hypothetical protein